jgi:hypothetical protein
MKDFDKTEEEYLAEAAAAKMGCIAVIAISALALLLTLYGAAKMCGL